MAFQSFKHRLIHGVKDRWFPNRWSVRSFSLEGEDLLAAELLHGTQQGFYVDIGCNHPIRLSNTYLFYKRGWSGLCIDPLPGTRAAFNRYRPRDTVLEMGVSSCKRDLTYHQFNESALNTFSAEMAIAHATKPGYQLTGKITLPTAPLTDIFAEQTVGAIDFMSLDVEGLDLEVLASNDWSIWRPRVLVAECLSATLANLNSDQVNRFMSEKGYVAVQKTARNIVFLDSFSRDVR